jgi:hypothetical protein
MGSSVLTILQFIERATGQGDEAVNHNWKSEATEIRPIRVTHPRHGPVVFVDTPGLDDTFTSDTVIVGKITEWLVDA